MEVQLLMGHQDVAEVARTYDVPYDSLRNHRNTHMPRALIHAASITAEEMDSEWLLNHVLGLLAKAAEVLENHGADPRVAIAAIRAANDVTRTLASTFSAAREDLRQGAIDAEVSRDNKNDLRQLLEADEDLRREIKQMIAEIEIA